MKCRSRFLVVFLVLSVLAVNVLHAGDFDFRFNLKKGEKFEYVYASTDKVDQTKQGVPASIEQESSLTFGLRVTEKLKNGGYKLAVDYKKFVTHIVMNGNKVAYNSDSVYKSNQYADLLKGINKVHYTFDLSPLGVVSNIKGFEEWTQKINADVRLSNILKGVGTEGFITSLLNYLPQGKVKPGSKWAVSTVLPEMKDLKYDMNYRFLESKADQIKLGLTSKIEYKQPKIAQSNVDVSDKITQQGDLFIDQKSFMPISYKIVQVSNLVITRTNPRTLVDTTTPMTIETEKSLKLVSGR